MNNAMRVAFVVLGPESQPTSHRFESWAEEVDNQNEVTPEAKARLGELDVIETGLTEHENGFARDKFRVEYPGEARRRLRWGRSWDIRRKTDTTPLQRQSLSSWDSVLVSLR
jgi:hypothetical protein